MLTQERLGELLGTALGHAGYSGAAVSDWERNKSKIEEDDRPVLMGLISVLVACQGLHTVREANELLQAGNYRALDAAEQGAIFPHVMQQSPAVAAVLGDSPATSEAPEPTSDRRKQLIISEFDAQPTRHVILDILSIITYIVFIMTQSKFAQSLDPLVPLHIQIRQALVRKVHSGELKPGEKLPSERELQDIFQASRTPVRMALEALEASGVIYRVQGRGSFVRKSQIGGAVREMITFGQILRDAGYDLTAKTLDVRMVTGNDELAPLMEIEVGTPLIYLRRLLYADNEPIILFDHYLRAVIRIEELTRNKKDFPSLYGLLKRGGFEPWESNQLISACLLDGLEASLLKVQVPYAALMINQTNYSVNKEVVWFSKFLIRPDRYRYPVSLQRRR